MQHGDNVRGVQGIAGGMGWRQVADHVLVAGKPGKAEPGATVTATPV
ncbi:hypothetical protein [Saccharothrix algeriensis]|uniref:Uncharacterized protein n=1 Tax=Saccharothrix algeriensis TaxID=173560 RepID=A0ABS2S9H0_9PSEU|nr:hypothetical protein [Saccharothrix algeriensis]